MKNNYKTKKNFLFLSFFIISQIFYSQQTYTFTNAGATGSLGPTQVMVNNAYTLTNLQGSVTVSGSGIQSWTVPATGGYGIRTIGGSGGTPTTACVTPGGKGANMYGEFNLTAGQVIKILVGQMGSPSTASEDSGGGGGSFVVTSGNIPLIVSGGGGGSTNGTSATVCGASPGLNAVITTAGTAGANSGGAGGTNGSGGTGTGGGAGGGFTTNGTGGGPASFGLSFLNGGPGGNYTSAGPGGFGGGGSGYWEGGNGGGGGGYSGGGTNSTLPYSGGGGGGSYNSGANQSNAVATATGQGKVLITELCNISVYGSTSNPLMPAICSGQSLTLTTNAVSNYSWSTGATTSSIVVAPTTNTVYSLSATSVSNCVAAKSISVVVSGSQPTLSVVSSTNQTCLGKTATLTASGAVTYTWTGGVTNGVSFYPSTTTTYTVTGDNGCGIVTAMSTISVSPLAMTAVTSATAVCTNKTATLSVTAVATSYTWQPGNIIGSSPNLIVSPQVNTTFTITASDGTCSGINMVSLIANPVPTITSSSSSSTSCGGDLINLSAGGGINYTWTPGNMNGSNVTVNPFVSTLYTVIGDNSFGCFGNSNQVIVVGASPTLVLTSNSPTICNGSAAILTVSGANTYTWTNGPNTTIYNVTPTQLTTYTVVGTNTLSLCSDTKTISIDVVTPVVSITGNTAICAGSSAVLTAGGATSYTWSENGTPFPSITLSPLVNTTYTVFAVSSINNLNCPVTATVEVVVNPNPTITAVGTRVSMCAKESNTLTASGAISYTWMTTNTTVVGPSLQITSPVATILIYTVTGTNAQGCETSLTVPFNISACSGIEQISGGSRQLAVYPNPNNGEFTIQTATEMTLSLINELGQVIKQVQLDEKNDLKFSVSDLPNGIYFIIGDTVKEKIIVNK